MRRKIMKKKLVALILIGSMALSFTACGNSSDSSKGTKESSKKTEASAETPKEEAKEEVKEPVVLTGKWEYTKALFQGIVHCVHNELSVEEITFEELQKIPSQ